MKRDKDDAAFSLMIRERDEWTCQRCGKVFIPPTRGLHSAHCFSRGKPATRLDPLNACSLCYGCHRFLDGRFETKKQFFRARLGDEVFEALELRSNQRRSA